MLGPFVLELEYLFRVPKAGDAWFATPLAFTRPYAVNEATGCLPEQLFWAEESLEGLG